MGYKQKEYRILQKTNRNGDNTFQVEECERRQTQSTFEYMFSLVGIVLRPRYVWSDWNTCREIQGDQYHKEYKNLIFESLAEAEDWLQKLRIKEHQNRLEATASEIVSTKEIY